MKSKTTLLSLTFIGGLALSGCGGGSSSTASGNNHAPVANAQTVTLENVRSKEITLTGSDADGDTLTYSIVSKPTLGTLSGTAPNLLYTTTALDYGADSFTFRVNDGTENSSIATVKINIKNASAGDNNAPTVDAGSDQVISEGRDVTLSAQGADSDGYINSYVWKDSSNRIIGNTRSITLSNLLVGVYTYTVYVTDNGGKMASDSVTVTVKKAVSYLPVKKTGQTVVYSNYDDGYYQSGTDFNYTRDDANQIVTDHVTGLQWTDFVINDERLKRGNIVKWEDAVKYCNELTLDGGGWYLPSIYELNTLYYYDNEPNESGFTSLLHPIFVVDTTFISWSSTRDTAPNSIRVWVSGGDNSLRDKTAVYISTRCVRKYQP